MVVHVTHDELEEILRLKLEPIENSLNFKRRQAPQVVGESGQPQEDRENS